MSTIEWIQVTVTPHEVFTDAYRIHVDVQTPMRRYHTVVQWPNSDFTSHFDDLLDIAKREILTLVREDQARVKDAQ